MRRIFPSALVIALSVVFSVALSAACSDEESQGLPVPEPSEVKTLNEALALSWCTFLYECESNDDRQFADELGDKGSCFKFFTAEFDTPNVRQMTRLVALGRVRWDRDRYLECVGRVRATCSPDVATCPRMLVGAADAGGA